MPSPACLELGIPAHLHEDGRPLDDTFSPDERLFHRIPPGFVHSNKVLPEAIKTRRTSVVREKYSNGPMDCLFDATGGGHCLGFAVAEFRVQQVENLSNMHPTTGEPYTFKVRHDPLECLYPHCEIRTLQAGKVIEEITPKSIKTWLKQELARLAVIVHPASASA